MTEVEVLRWAITICLGGFVWFLKRTLTSAEDRIKELQLNLQDVKEKYLHKDDFREFKVELRGMFQEIRDNIKQLSRHE